MSVSARISRARKQKASLTRRKITVALLVAAVVFAIASVGGGAAIVAASWLQDLPDHTVPGAFDTSQPTEVYAADGTLLARFFMENRESIPLDRMSPFVLKAIVAVEDERFYQHKGVDPYGIARSVVKTASGSRQGASTLTQQYIRQTILMDEANEISLKRKFREAYLALELEKIYSKEDILAMYLNTVYFGERAYGIQVASETYFGKDAIDLTLAEAATLAGIPQRPTGHNPYKYPEATLERRAHVLNRMLENNFITQAEYDEANAAELQLDRVKNPKEGIYAAHYFVSAVRRQLREDFSEGTVFGGGLKVYTTIDMRMQKAAEKTMKNAIGSSGPEGALACVDPENGFVKAIVGGRSYNKNTFSMATQAHRQAGSSFKTFTLVTALNEGMSPSFRVDSSSPATIGSKPRPWIVNNSEGRGRGQISLYSATAGSVNTVYARVCHEIGAAKVAEMAQKMGIQTELHAYDSIALGAQNVTVLEMASAYATLAAGGIYNKPTFIERIEDRTGEPIYQWEDEGKRVISKEVAYAATQVLKGVVSGGTGTRARLSGWEVAGKTGTSQRNRDVWFVGYTPVLSTAVWVGHPKEQTIIFRGSRAFGGTVCAPIWRSFMQEALKGMKAKRFKTAGAPPYNNSKFHIPVSKPPELEGLTWDKAKSMLYGFDVDRSEEFSDDVKAGRIISVKFKGSKAIVKVSKGRDPAKNQPDAAVPPPVTPPPSQPTTRTP